MLDNTGKVVLRGRDEEDIDCLLNNPLCVIHEESTGEEGKDRLSYFREHGAGVFIQKYGNATRKVYENLGLVYPR